MDVAIAASSSDDSRGNSDLVGLLAWLLVSIAGCCSAHLCLDNFRDASEDLDRKIVDRSEVVGSFLDLVLDTGADDHDEGHNSVDSDGVEEGNCFVDREAKNCSSACKC
jgi:hypothetical protein